MFQFAFKFRQLDEFSLELKFARIMNKYFRMELTSCLHSTSINQQRSKAKMRWQLNWLTFFPVQIAIVVCWSLSTLATKSNLTSLVCHPFSSPRTFEDFLWVSPLKEFLKFQLNIYESATEDDEELEENKYKSELQCKCFSKMLISRFGEKLKATMIRFDVQFYACLIAQK